MVESDVIYVGTVFSDKNEAYDAYNSYALAKSFGARKHKTTKSRPNQKIMWGRFVYNKEGHKERNEGLEGQDVLFPRDI